MLHYLPGAPPVSVPALTPALPPLRPPPALPPALPSAGAALARDDTALELELELELEELQLELLKLENAKNPDGDLTVEVFVEELFHRGLLLVVDESEDATE